VPRVHSLGGGNVFSADTAQANQPGFPPRCLLESRDGDTIRVQQASAADHGAAACIDAPEMAQAFPYGETCPQLSAEP